MKEFGKLRMWDFKIGDHDICSNGVVMTNQFHIEWDYYNEILHTDITIDENGILNIDETRGDTVLIDGLESEIYDYAEEIIADIKRLFKHNHGTYAIGACV